MARSNPQLAKLYFPVMKTIQRHWAARLTLPQYTMLNFVNERTLRFGKIKERMTVRDARMGIRNQQTLEVIHAGVNLGKTAIVDALKGLEDAGLIEQEIPVNGSPQGRYVTLLVDRVLEPAEMADIGVSRRIRRRRRSG